MPETNLNIPGQLNKLLVWPSGRGTTQHLATILINILNFNIMSVESCNLEPKASETTENIPRTSRKILNYFRLAFAFHAQKPKRNYCGKAQTEGKPVEESTGEMENSGAGSICIFLCWAARSMIKWPPTLSIMTSKVFAFKLRWKVRG